jgi:hypothetical protein
MPIPSTISAISGNYPDIARNPDNWIFKKVIHINQHFLPSGEPISPHLLRCGPFAVDDHSRGQALSS